MGKIAKGVNKISFTMLYGNYCYIIIDNFSQKFSPCSVLAEFAQESRSIFYVVVSANISTHAFSPCIKFPAR